MKKRNAFTLIELLVVIAIIAILAAILFPVFAQAKVAAKKIKAVSQTKQIGTGVAIYMADYDDVFPPKLRIGFGTMDGGGDPYHSMTWDDLVYPYIKNWDMFVSSEDVRAKYSTPHGQYRRSYAPASNLFLGVQVSASMGWGWTQGFGGLSGTTPPQISSTVMFVEVRQPSFTVPNIRDADEWWYDTPAYNTRTANLPSSDPRAPYGQIDNQYANGSVFVFADTSTKVLKQGGVNGSGLPSGTLLPGYEEKAAWWVGGSGDPFWDQGVSCLDAPWNPNDGSPCKLPGQ